MGQDEKGACEALGVQLRRTPLSGATQHLQEPETWCRNLQFHTAWCGGQCTHFVDGDPAGLKGPTVWFTNPGDAPTLRQVYMKALRQLVPLCGGRGECTLFRMCCHGIELEQ